MEGFCALSPLTVLNASSGRNGCIHPQYDHNLVRQIQQHLREHAVQPGGVDGAFGPKTESAIRKFERDNQLPVDGIPSPELLEFLLPAVGPPKKKWSSVMSFNRIVGYLGLLGLVLIAIVTLTLGGCTSLLCTLHISHCVDLEISAQNSEHPKLTKLEAKLDQIDERRGTRVTVATSNRGSCTIPNCRLRLKYDLASVQQEMRFLVTVQAIGTEGEAFSSNDNDFVLTYGFPQSINVRLERRLSANVAAIMTYVDGVRREISTDEQPGTDRKVVGGFIAPNSFFEAFFEHELLVAIKESTRTGDRVIFDFYFAKDGKFVAAYQAKSPDPLSAGLRVYFDPGGRPTVITSDPQPPPGSDEVLAHQFSDRFRSLAQEADRLRVGTAVTSANARYGMYTYGSGLNVIDDCETKARWWVVGPPALISRLHQEYLTRRIARSEPLLMNYQGSVIPEMRSLSDMGGTSGNIQLSSFQFSENSRGSCSSLQK
jgi:peptidoglycan hydrolase-like protein with peptidoglycan-binding domain